jgi:hypothetical protein
MNDKINKSEEATQQELKENENRLLFVLIEKMNSSSIEQCVAYSRLFSGNR